MNRVLILAVLLVAGSSTQTAAQHHDPIRPGTRVRFSLTEETAVGPMHNRVRGTVLSVADGVIAVAVQGRTKTLMVPAWSATELEYLPPRRPPSVQGARVGLVVGALIGTMMASGTIEGDCMVHVGGTVGCPVVGGIVGGLGGALVGVALGFLVGQLFPDSWQSVPTGPVNIPLALVR